MELKNTQTEENLKKALAGESIARNKYTYFAAAARANGDTEIADAFERMAQNEMMHAKFWFEQLYGKPGDTRECLMQAAQGEYSEWHSMYPEFARQAREEGLEELALMLAKMSQKPGEPVQQASTQPPARKQKKEGYRCQFCGAIFQTRPDVCDTCQAIGAFDCVEYYE